MSSVKPFITSCQSRYFCHICHFCKNRQPSTCHFLSSHLNIWPNPWWIFAILAILAEICLYRLNLLFPYNHHLSGIGSCYLYKMPVSVVLFKFCQTLDRFFQKFVDFAKIAFLLTPTINDIPLLSSCFNCCQTLNKFLPNWPFSPKLLFSLIIKRQFSQTFYESLPNSWILQHLSLS